MALYPVPVCVHSSFNNNKDMNTILASVYLLFLILLGLGVNKYWKNNPIVYYSYWILVIFTVIIIPMIVMII